MACTQPFLTTFFCFNRHGRNVCLRGTHFKSNLGGFGGGVIRPFQKRGERFSFSPEEKAGMRASVKTILSPLADLTDSLSGLPVFRLPNQSLF